MSGIVGSIGSKSGIVTVPNNQLGHQGDGRYDVWKRNTTDLICYWKADHVTNSTGNQTDGTMLTSGLVYDASNSMTVEVEHGTIFYDNGNGYAPNGRCFTFNNNGVIRFNQSSTANYNTYYNSPSSFTCMAWLDWDGSSRQGFLSRYGSSAPAINNIAHFNHMLDSRTQWHHNASGVNLGSGNETGHNWTSDQPSDWNMMVITYDVSDGYWRRYIDGHLWHIESGGTNSGHGFRGPSSSGTYYNNNTPITFGGRTDGAEKMIGKVAEVSLWKRALSQQEVLTWWDATKGNFERTDEHVFG